MYKVFLFAGTTEGRELAEFLSRAGVEVFVFTATEYGKSLIREAEHMVLSPERLSAEEMEEQIRAEKPDLVVDATHPYAELVTENIRSACIHTYTELIRLVRDEGTWDGGDITCVSSAKEAAEFLSRTEGNVLLTTGSKDLAEFTAVPEFEERIYARVLSLPDVVKSCDEMGFRGNHLICMQGPFSKELNTAMLRQYGCKWMVTKASGMEGGFPEKLEAAKEAGAKLLIIGRPKKEAGLTFKECRKMLKERFQIPYRPEITLAGVGMGSIETMTGEAVRACQKADLLIGAGRVLETAKKAAGNARKAEIYEEYKSEEILAYIKAHPFYDHIAIAVSGDPGFYSGAKKLYGLLSSEKEWNVRAVSGISSLSYFMAKLRISWEDAVMVSCHGQKRHLVRKIAENGKVFAILGTGTQIGELAKELLQYGLWEVTLHIGERLSYPGEKIRSGPPKEFLCCKTDTLSVLCVENPKPRNRFALHSLQDDLFVRGKVPMTKEEVRSITLSKLQLLKDAVCYDIGAGTGSVSIEMAEKADEGRVYAVEKKPEAADLIRQNRRKFCMDSIHIVEGTAPEALKGLEPPTHVFIGGTSGGLTEILHAVLKKNPRVRIVMNCITLETLTEAVKAFQTLPVTKPDIVNVTVSRAKKAGSYHLMMGENPVYILSCTGTGEVRRED